ncbi:hypothetical protein [Microbacterium paraoxydans]|uniref:Uncharacterized protein n=1 Tax=Microbacterium paraoxydans TaxID=199592 RepID=A0A1H1TJT0_9MICO|nr:hypothetical protein [Microbacterium paraoxydans]SDS60503.1 hypothetical protein SAMN04489809_2230 [Microbacterium paraoxydans]
MFAGASVYFLLVYVVVPLLALLLLWLIIYSAVRAALTAPPRPRRGAHHRAGHPLILRFQRSRARMPRP